MRGRNITFGDRNETGETRFRSQQVVTVGVQSVVRDPVPDGKLLSGVIKKKAEIHCVEHVLSLLRDGRQAANESGGIPR